MKKTFVMLMALAIIAGEAFAGGIMTNTNQSASFIRNPSRGASLDVDAVYFNPAGLVFLKDGFHFSLNNQTISQERKINTDFQGLNRSEFIGSVSAPLFPSVYAAYKKDNFAFALGLNPIGGGGSAFYEEGLPSFEMQVAMVPMGLSSAGISTTQYQYDVEFDGRSIFWGFQGVAAYKVSDMFSVSAGVRYLTAKNEYNGYLKDIMINPNQPAFGANYNGTNMVLATTFFTDASNTFTAWFNGATAYVSGLQPIITGGGGGVLLVNGEVVGLTATQIAQIQGLIMAAGQNPAEVDIATAQAILNAAAPVFAASSTIMAQNAAATADKEVAATQTGSSIVPIIGFSLRPADNLVIGFKYEHKGSMTLKNKTEKDDTGLFPDGDETPSDMPSMFALGVTYGATPKLRLSGTVHYYLDKNANYGKKLAGASVSNSEVIDSNLWEAAFGVEYLISRNFLVSAGYLRTQTGVKDVYQSDLSHSLSTNSIGAGLRYGIMDKIGLNLGVMNTWYTENVRAFSTFNETYNRKAFVLAVGVDVSF